MCSISFNLYIFLFRICLTIFEVITRLHLVYIFCIEEIPNFFRGYRKCFTSYILYIFSLFRKYLTIFEVITRLHLVYIFCIEEIPNYLRGYHKYCTSYILYIFSLFRKYLTIYEVITSVSQLHFVFLTFILLHCRLFYYTVAGISAVWRW